MAVLTSNQPRPGDTIEVTTDVVGTLSSVVTAEWNESLDVGTCTVTNGSPLTFTYVQPNEGLALGEIHYFRISVDGSYQPTVEIRVLPEDGFTAVTLERDASELHADSRFSTISGLATPDQIIHTALDPAGNPITIDPVTGLIETTYAREVAVNYYILDESGGYDRGTSDTITLNSNVPPGVVSAVDTGAAVVDGGASVDFNYSNIPGLNAYRWAASNGDQTAWVSIATSGDSGVVSVDPPNLAGATGDYVAPIFGDVVLEVTDGIEVFTSGDTLTYSPSPNYSVDLQTSTVGVTTTTMTGSTAVEGNISFGRTGGAYPDGTQVYWPTAGTDRSIDEDGSVNNRVSFVLFARPPGVSTWERIEWNQNTNPQLNSPANITADSGVEFTITWQVTAGDYDSVALSPNDLTVVDNGIGQITATGSLTAAQTYTLTATNSLTGATDSDSVSINITGSLPLPSITAASSFGATEEEAFTFDFTVDDLDLSGSDTLTATLSSATGVSVANITGNTYRVSGTAPSFELTESDTLTITATNSEGSDTATVNVNYVDVPEPSGPATYTATSGQSFNLVYTLNGPSDSVLFSNGGFAIGAVTGGQVTVSGALDFANGSSQTLTFTVVRGGVNYTVNTVVTVEEVPAIQISFNLVGLGVFANSENFSPNPGVTRASEPFTLYFYHPSSGDLHATSTVSTNASGIFSNLTLSQENFTNIQAGLSYYLVVKDSSGYVTVRRISGTTV